MESQPQSHVNVDHIHNLLLCNALYANLYRQIKLFLAISDQEAHSAVELDNRYDGVFVFLPAICCADRHPHALFSCLYQADARHLARPVKIGLSMQGKYLPSCEGES